MDKPDGPSVFKQETSKEGKTTAKKANKKKDKTVDNDPSKVKTVNKDTPKEPKVKPKIPPKPNVKNIADNNKNKSADKQTESNARCCFMRCCPKDKNKEPSHEQPAKVGNVGEQLGAHVNLATSPTDDVTTSTTQEQQSDDTGGSSFCLCCCKRKKKKPSRPPVKSKEGKKFDGKTCCLKFLAFLFSHVGITCLVVAYAIGGGFLFQHIESAAETQQRRFMSESTNVTVEKVMHRGCVYLE